jgi:hypothetical protein
MVSEGQDKTAFLSLRDKGETMDAVFTPEGPFTYATEKPVTVCGTYGQYKVITKLDQATKELSRPNIFIVKTLTYDPQKP